ncbi:hypothetical protein WA026_022413 [Henosepilachna vigintioctopunctata]|uniref:Peptidase S1 domain-containing protein n=1 Tax=Henosepilachna vigintioctopunctata TaxID=420089 RepID=A0AAW1U472_9CUCU
MTVIVIFSVFLVWILKCFLGETAHICQPNLICVPHGECEIRVNEGEILYPCRNGICCPKLKNSISGTTRRYEPFNTIKTTSYPDIYIDHENKQKGTTPSYEYINENIPYISQHKGEEYTRHSNEHRNGESNNNKDGSLNRITNTINEYLEANTACGKDFFCVPLSKCDYNTGEVLYPCGHKEENFCCPKLKNQEYSASTTQKYEPFNTIKPSVLYESNFLGNSSTNTMVQVDRTKDTISIHENANRTRPLFIDYNSNNKIYHNENLTIEENNSKNNNGPNVHTNVHKDGNFLRNNTIYNIPSNDKIPQQSINTNENINQASGSKSKFNISDQNKLSQTTNRNIFSKECGLTNSQDKITGGKIADLGQFPWMALLGFKHHSGESLQFLCGGSLITRRDVLTAAHCIVENRHLELYSIRLGEYNLTTDRDCVEVGKYKTCADHHVDVGIEKVTVHPMFNRKTFKNDIAIIRIRKEVEMTDFISTICLPFDKDYSNIDMTGENFTVSGWGKSNSGDLFGTNEIQYAKVTAWDPIKCNNSLPSEVKPLSPTQLCANGAKSEDACKGDSGGPLINVTLDKDLEVKHIQFGIVSFGTGTCGDRNLPSVYTRVDKYLDWIMKTVS